MIYDGKYGDVEPGTFKDFVRRSIFTRRQQAEVMQHLSLLHMVSKNTEKANSTLKTFMSLSLPYLYDDLQEIDEQKKAAAIMREYEGKVIEFTKLPGTDDNSLDDPYKLTSYEERDTKVAKNQIPPELIANKKDPLAKNKK